MDTVKIDSICGETWEGFKITHQRQLPKKAKQYKYIYDEDLNIYSIYLSVAAKSTKIYILKSI